jgi:hypothetical protein
MTPRIELSVRGMPWEGLKASFSEYRGLVPISPKTTPIAATASEGNGCLGT